jgi:hypothetical protein
VDDSLMDYTRHVLHEYDELFRYFTPIKRDLAARLAAPRAGALAVFFAAMLPQGAAVMTTTVDGRPHAFIRMEYSTGEYVDVDVAGEEVGTEEIRIELAGKLHESAFAVPLNAVEPEVLLAAAAAAKACDYPETARKLIKATQVRSDRLLS